MYRNRREFQRRRSGFTLVELMITLFILLLVMGLMVRNYLGFREKAKYDTATAYVKMLDGAVDQYNAVVGSYPATLDDLIICPQELDAIKWAGPYLKDSAVATDPWGNPYCYVYPGQHSRTGAADIWSWGPDMIDNNGDGDDIVSWR